MVTQSWDSEPREGMDEEGMASGASLPSQVPAAPAFDVP